MLSRFAIGLAMLLDASPIWSIEIPYYFRYINEVWCYQYDHLDLESLVIKKTNDRSFHLAYLDGGRLYFVLPSEYADPAYITSTIAKKRGKRSVRIEIYSSDFYARSDGRQICIEQIELKEDGK